MNFFRNKNLKFLLLGLFLAFSLFSIASIPVLAQSDTSTLGVNTVDQSIALGGGDIRVVVVRIINTALGLLGIIAVGIVLYGGFVYMTAGGEDDKISTAKKILTNGLIGLVIILSAFAITRFVLSRLSEATGLQTGDIVDTTLPGDCSDPTSAFFLANYNYCNPAQICFAKHFVVESITPSTKNADVVGMNNVVVRAVFSKQVGSNISDSLKIEKDGVDVTSNFDLNFVEDNFVIEAVPNTNDGCDSVVAGHCLSKGVYKISILDVKDKNGNTLEETTDCGTYPKDTSFNVGDETSVIDSIGPVLSDITLDGQSDNIHLVSGKLYPVSISTNDRVSPITYGGNSYVALNVYKESNSANILKSYISAPAISLGSSAVFSYNYSYRVPTDLEFNTNYILSVTGHDVDKNFTQKIIKFRVVPASCDNDIQDVGEDGVDTGGNCSGGLGATCQSQTDCSTSYKCLDPNDNQCNNSGNCICKKWPYIENVDQNNGAPGNWITISGRNFGNTVGEIAFNYDTNSDGIFDVTSTVSLAQCRGNNVWNNNWIIAEVPERPVGVAVEVKPSVSVRNLELLSASANPTSTSKFVDFSTDDFGQKLDPFQYNDTKRPGLCAVQQVENQSTSGEPKTSVVAIGKAFGVYSNSSSKLVFGVTEAGVSASSWSDIEIDSTVPFANAGKNAVYVENAGERSNSVLFTVLDSNADNLPIITDIDPATTTIGSYITITGKNFGWSEGQVTIAGVGTATIPAFCGSVWKDTQIIVKVSANTPVGSGQVVVTRSDIGRSSAGNNFVGIVTGLPTPSICKIEPDSGSAPLPSGKYLTLKGENFGTNPPTVFFWKNGANPNIVADASSWLNTNILHSTSNTKIEVAIPSIAGLSMSSGPVVVKAGEKFSNGVNYSVTDCRLPGQEIPDGYQCCQLGPEAGLLKDNNFLCKDTTREAGYAWRFTTGKLPEIFQVLEQCTLGSSTVVPSPSPWSSRSQGKFACLNAQIQAKFSLTIDETTLVNNVHVFTCGDSQGSVGTCGSEVTNQFKIETSGGDTVILNPKIGGSNLNPLQWYRVVLSKDLTSQKTVNVAGSGSVIKHEPLKATRPCDVGNNNYAYCFDFKTGNASDLCTLVGAGINPSSYTTTLLGVVQDVRWPLSYDLEIIFDANNPNIHPQNFDVRGITNQECVDMNVENLDWVWGPVTSSQQYTATAKKSPKNDDPKSRGIATAWQNNPGGSDIFAKLGVSASGTQKITDTFDLVQTLQSPVNPLRVEAVTGKSGVLIGSSYPATTVNNPSILYQDTNNLFVFDDNFVSLEASLNIDNRIPATTKFMLQNSNNTFTKDNYIVSQNNFSLYFTDITNIAGSAKPDSRILYFEYKKNPTDQITKKQIVLSSPNGDVDAPDYKISLTKNGNNLVLKVDNLLSAPTSTKSLTISDIDFASFNNTPTGGTVYVGSRNRQDLVGNVHDLRFRLYSTVTDFFIKRSHTVGVSVIQNIIATSTIRINLGDPSVIERWPSCTEACINAEIGVRFNQIMIPSTYANGYEVYKCATESCLSAGLTRVYGFNISDPNNTTVLSFDKDLEPNTWYLVSILNTIKADGGTGANGSHINGNSVQSTQWKFKTKDSAVPCVVDSVSVAPDPFSAYYIGQQTVYKAVAKGAVDSCSPQGQTLNSWKYGWDWSVEAPKIAETTKFSISGQYNAFCTQNCLPSGSIISSDLYDVNYPLCGNGRIDAGEDCDIARQGESAGVSCSYSCLRPGNTNTSCGNGIVENNLGEECDGGNYCSNVCLNIGSSNQATGNVAAPVCGSGQVTQGEDCDINDLASKLGCSSSCLHVGTQLSQSWCDNNSSTSSRLACKAATSICGNAVVESGEECELGVSGATESTCDNKCLLQNVCATPSLKQCNKGDVGCNDDCTLAGSSLSYSSSSICGDGAVGVGESNKCELSVGGQNVLGGSPTQIITAVGNPSTTNVVDKLKTHILATPSQYFDIDGILKPIQNSSRVQGSGEYNLMCGYTEYLTVQEGGVYNDCPSNQDNSFGVGTSSCCYPRLVRSAQYPTVNAGIQGSSEPAVCRNTYLEVDFPGEMNKASFTDNVSIIEGYDQEGVYNGYNCAAHGQEDVSEKINNYLALNNDAISDKGFWADLWQGIKSFFANLFTGNVLAISNFSPNNNLNGKHITWCATKIGLTPSAHNVYSTKVDESGHTVEFVSSTNVGLLLTEALDPNVYVLVILKGGKDGIKDKFGVSIKNADPSSTNIDDSWLFKTGSEICKIKNIAVEPSQHVFTTPTSQQDFTTNIISNSGGQLITPIPNFYDWKYSWGPGTNDIFNIPNVNTNTITIGSKGVEGEVDGIARVEVTTDVDQENSQVGNVFSKNFKLTAFFCANPWPTVNTSVLGSDSDKVSVDEGIFDDNIYNFSFLYCADNNNPLTKEDDLPLFENVTLVGNNLDDYGIGDAALRRYLLFSDDTSDALGIQIFENTPAFDGSPRSLEDWFIGKFGDIGSMKPTSVGGYEALTDGSNYYVSVFDVDKSTNSLGDVYNYIVLFSLTGNSSQDSTKVFEQIINNLKFNTAMTNYNKCLATVPAGGAPIDDLVGASDVIRNPNDSRNILVSSLGCNTDFDCRDTSGLPLSGSAGYCNNEKTKFFRDLGRISNLRVTQRNLDNYFTSDYGQNGFIGSLNSGSFVAGYTTSKWQNSWGLLNSYAGTVAVDSVNQWAGCDNNNPLTCWNAASSTYSCPQFAEVYEYRFVSSTKSYEIYAPFEYLQVVQDNAFVSKYVNNNKIKFGRYCIPGSVISYSPTNFSVCGDGIINATAGEECEPPNLQRCDGSVVKQCNPSTCTWDTLASSCDDLRNKSCGNGVVDGTYVNAEGVTIVEKCDDGELNGRYGHCTSECQVPVAGSQPGFCGDGTFQATYEYCEKTDTKFQTGFCSGNKTLSCVDNSACKIITGYETVASVCVRSIAQGDHCQGISPKKSCTFIFDGTTQGCGGLTYEKAITTDFGTCVSVNEPSYDFQKINSCSYDCSAPGGYCGDGVTQWNYEQCDDANTNDNDGCKNDCTAPVQLSSQAICGNGSIESGETCDDNNTTANDGCSAICMTETPQAYCGDGKVAFDDKNNNAVKDAGELDIEQCDLGSQNGTQCVPGYSQSCTYCSANCTTQTIESTQICGNGVVDVDSVGNLLEQCDYKLTNGVQTSVTGYREQGGLGYVTCQPEQKGSYQCTNNCQVLQNNCISCGMASNLPLPQIGIINPMVTGGDTKYTDQPFVTLYKVNNNGSLGKMETTVPVTTSSPDGWRSTWTKINFAGINPGATFISSSVQHSLIRDGKSTVPVGSNLGIETSNQCSYKLFFNPNFVSSTVAGYGASVSAKVSAGLGDLFDYPVNNEVGVVNNEVIMSPAVPPEYVRVVIRWKKNGNVKFVGNFYSDKVTDTFLTSYRYSNAQSVDGLYGLMGAGLGGNGDTTKNSDVMNRYVYPSAAGFGYTDGLQRFYFHPIISTDYSGTQAITFESNSNNPNPNTPIPSSTLGFYVSSPNDQINRLLNNDVWVEVYHYHNGQVNMFSIYNPDFVFKLDNANSSASQSANYWHVFNIHMDSGNIVVLPVGSNDIPADRTQYLNYMINNPFTANYGGSLVTGECGVRAGMPNTTKCNY